MKNKDSDSDLLAWATIVSNAAVAFAILTRPEKVNHQPKQRPMLTFLFPKNRATLRALRTALIQLSASAVNTQFNSLAYENTRASILMLEGIDPYKVTQYSSKLQMSDNLDKKIAERQETLRLIDRQIIEATSQRHTIEEATATKNTKRK